MGILDLEDLSEENGMRVLTGTLGSVQQERGNRESKRERNGNGTLSGEIGKWNRNIDGGNGSGGRIYIYKVESEGRACEI